MSNHFPQSFRNITPWAAENGLSVEESRTRFVQYIVLCGIASVRSLRDHLVFKGGNALDFVLQPNRSTIDLDFSLDMEGGASLANADDIRNALALGLRRVSPRFDMAVAVHSVRQNPPGQDKSFITFRARLGFALPDEQQLRLRMANNQTSPHVLPIDISINEPIHSFSRFTVSDDYSPLRISTLEDIVGEKLRALLQQPIRNRSRQQDMLDLAVVVLAIPTIDRL